MLAQKNPDIDQAITSMYLLSEDFNIREQMIRREEYLATEKYKNETIEKQQKALDEKDKALNDQQKALDDQKKALDEKDKIIAELQSKLAVKS